MSNFGNSASPSAGRTSMQPSLGVSSVDLPAGVRALAGLSRMGTSSLDGCNRRTSEAATEPKSIHESLRIDRLPAASDHGKGGVHRVARVEPKNEHDERIGNRIGNR